MREVRGSIPLMSIFVVVVVVVVVLFLQLFVGVLGKASVRRWFALKAKDRNCASGTRKKC